MLVVWEEITVTNEVFETEKKPAELEVCFAASPNPIMRPLFQHGD
jgi:hypothetical protein